MRVSFQAGKDSLKPRPRWVRPAQRRGIHRHGPDPIALLDRARRRARLRPHDGAARDRRRSSSSRRKTSRRCSNGSRSTAIELTDDCSRAIEEEVALHEPAGRVGDDRLAAAVPERGRPLPAADRRAGGRAREADRARRQAGEGPAHQLEPAARRLDREEVPGPRPDAARPDPGGDHRPDPRRGEVRLAQGLQVLDVRDVVDPPGGAARRREQGAHDPHPGAHRRARAEDLARRARARREARARADRRGARRAVEAAGEAGARGAHGGARGRVARQAGRRRRLRVVRRPVRERREARRTSRSRSS